MSKETRKKAKRAGLQAAVDVLIARQRSERRFLEVQRRYQKGGYR